MAVRHEWSDPARASLVHLFSLLSLFLVTALALPACDGSLTGEDGTPDGGVTPRDGGPPVDRDSGTPPPDDGGGSPIDAATPADTGPTDPCAGVSCGANARCEPSTRACVCVPGFVMMGSACVAIPPGDPAGRTASEVCGEWAAGHVQNARDPWNEVPGDMCGAGSLTREALDDTVRRVNLFRWLVGLGPVSDDASQHPNDQACAVMMYRNGALNHMPPMSWTCWTMAGATGAGSSNLALGVRSPGDAIDLYMDDSGVPSLGHRRWVLNGPLGRVGIGFAGNAQCLGVFDRSGSSARDWTAWPNPGPVPLAAIRGLWSFHSNRLALGSATPSVVRVSDGAALGVSVSHPPDGYGPSTVAWQPMGWSATVGERYRVTIDGVSGGPITYEVEPVSCP